MTVSLELLAATWLDSIDLERVVLDTARIHTQLKVWQVFECTDRSRIQMITRSRLPALSSQLACHQGFPFCKDAQRFSSVDCKVNFPRGGIGP